MEDGTIPTRSEIKPEYTWNAASLFVSNDAWQTEYKRIMQSLPHLSKYLGHLKDGPKTLAEAIDEIEELGRRVGKILVYAGMAHSVDTTDQIAAGMQCKSQALYGQILAAVAFFDPELLSIGKATICRWIKEEPRLTFLDHYISDLFRKQAHVRSSEVEELLGMLADPFAGTSGAARMLTNADFKFKPAISCDGHKIPVAQGTLSRIYTSADRQARQTAWESYSDTYLAYKNTLSKNLATSIKQDVYQMRARHHKSTLDASLFEYNIPVDVFYNLIDTFRKNLPTWHRYWAIRRRALGVDVLHPYDIWAPLTKERLHVPFEQAVKWICEALAPLGDEYVRVLRKGCFEDRWIDIYPNQGKRQGAFSSGSNGTYPFIMMSFNNTVFSLSTLAHELGHSMHSYLTWQNQPIIYSDYALFVAEVASNVHQALVRAYLMKNNNDPSFQINLIEEAMNNFHRYLFIMPTLARFELETHERIERGDSLTADDMISLMADLFSEGYGDEIHVDRERVGITWAQFGHLYVDYYVFQYATGISAAHAIANRFLSGEKGAAKDHLDFLKAGGSVYPIDALKIAGVDLASPLAVEETFKILSTTVDKLEELLAKK